MLTGSPRSIRRSAFQEVLDARECWKRWLSYRPSCTSFKPMWHAGSEAQKAQARATISSLLDILSGNIAGEFGATPSVADFYLFVMLLWAERFDVAVPAPLVALGQRMANRPAVKQALRQEGLISATHPPAITAT